MLILLLQANLIKESIRMGYNDMGDFFYAHGNLLDAFKSYLRTRDYFTTSKHIVQMCMNVILVSIELGQFAHVSNYVSKAEQTPDLLDPIIVAKLRAAAGVAYMETKKYKLAARKVSHIEFHSGCLIMFLLLIHRCTSSMFMLIS
jgi:COP9 signalosome complex subunit 1